VGYCGGDKKNPSYYDLGDQTEAITIDYDPEVLSYDDMLKLFWSAHRCDQVNTKRQYMNAVFYRNEEQKKLAETSKVAEAKRRGLSLPEVQTEIIPMKTFTYAEGYHHKYYLTRYRDVRGFLEEVYPEAKSLADSTVAMKLNAYLGSGMKKDWKVFLEELPNYDLPRELEKALAAAVEKQLAEE
jgi:peptide-methionine (S)-S-oxide reductase